MKVQKSPFIIENIFITESNFKTISKKDSSRLEKNLDLELNFDIKYSKKDNKELFLIIVNLDGNNKTNPKPGYFFSIQAQGIFSFESKQDKKVIDNFLLYSGLPLIINTLRGFVLNMTSYFPYGKYLMDLIDVNSLIENNITSKSKGKDRNLDKE